jgi:hypothetical protein
MAIPSVIPTLPGGGCMTQKLWSGGWPRRPQAPQAGHRGPDGGRSAAGKDMVEPPRRRDDASLGAQRSFGDGFTSITRARTPDRRLPQDNAPQNGSSAAKVVQRFCQPLIHDCQALSCARPNTLSLAKPPILPLRKANFERAFSGCPRAAQCFEAEAVTDASAPAQRALADRATFGVCCAWRGNRQ